jgi:putative flippase GtrA
MMSLSPARLLEHARSPDGRKQLRYVGVSIVFVPLGQALIQVLARPLDSYTTASWVSAAILTPPNFFANRYFVWKVSSKDNLRTQIIVFWVGAMLGVSMATGLTYLVEQATTDRPALFRSVAVFFAQLLGFGIVWVGRYLVLDRWLFKVTRHGEEPDEEEIDELHHDFPI